MRQVLLAHAEGDAAIAARVAEALEAAGVAVARVGPPSLKADKARYDSADALVLVWSRRAAGEPGLRREGAAAAARGRLVVARADGTGAPAAFRGAPTIAAAASAKLARTLQARSAPQRTRSMNAAPAPNNEASTWKGALLLAVLLAGVAWGAAWVSLGSSPAPLIMALLKG
jgi:hypothetical protein